MWSSKAQKETFLFYMWSAALGVTTLQGLYHLIK